ncbi:hypothetical protein [Streptomyces albiaxialis]|uniref:hypothetical protein n=1 Tax=Streptomyces albiaxialis TaxID=329523 RepID=UPI0031DE830B
MLAVVDDQQHLLLARRTGEGLEHLLGAAQAGHVDGHDRGAAPRRPVGRLRDQRALADAAQADHGHQS